MGNIYFFEKIDSFLRCVWDPFITPPSTNLVDNGKVDRKYGQILDTVRWSLLISSYFPRVFQGEAILTTVNLLNRCPLLLFLESHLTSEMKLWVFRDTTIKRQISNKYIHNLVPPENEPWETGVEVHIMIDFYRKFNKKETRNSLFI